MNADDILEYERLQWWSVMSSCAEWTTVDTNQSLSVKVDFSAVWFLLAINHSYFVNWTFEFFWAHLWWVCFLSTCFGISRKQKIKENVFSYKAMTTVIFCWCWFKLFAQYFMGKLFHDFWVFYAPMTLCSVHEYVQCIVKFVVRSFRLSSSRNILLSIGLNHNRIRISHASIMSVTNSASWYDHIISKEIANSSSAAPKTIYMKSAISLTKFSIFNCKTVLENYIHILSSY